MQQQPDWFECLKLTPDASAEQIEQAVKRLSLQAAALEVGAPERSQWLRDTVRSIEHDLLSGPENRARYDAARAWADPAAPGPFAFPSVSVVSPGPELPPPAAPPWPASPPPAAPPRLAAPSASQVLGGLEALGSRVARFLRTGWTCSACGKEAMPSDKFCTKCGTAITPVQRDAARLARAVCGNCNAALGINDAFCARCGTSVER